MENPNKVRNLVDGNLEKLSELYMPYLFELAEDGYFKFNSEGNLVFTRTGSR